MQTVLDSLNDEVARLSGIKDSIDAGFAAIKKQLADALANQGDPAVFAAAVKSLHDGLDSVQAAVVANTGV
jgi:FKBP-type peptidyl-prolyl cis-trans isomerase (trigger factor)